MIRVIPRLETYPRVVQFVQSAAGRFLLVALFAAFFYSFQFSPSMPLTIYWQELVTLFILGSRRLPLPAKFCAALLWAYFFSHDFASIVGISGLEDTRSSAMLLRLDGGRHAFFTQGLALGGAIALFAVCLRLLSLSRTRTPIAWLFPLWIIILWGVHSLDAASEPAAVGWSMFYLFTISIFPLCYLHLGRQHLPKDHPWEWIAFSLQGIFADPKLTYLRTPRLLQEKKSSQEFATCQIRALKLLVWARLILLLSDLLNYLLFHVWKWPNYAWIGFAKYNEMHLPAAQSWMLIFLNNIFLLCAIAATSGIAVATYRLAGIYIPRSMFRPHRAASFLDFYRRCFFYYSEILVHIFFQPVFHLVGKLNGHRLMRTQLSLFLTVLAGGLIFHILFVWQQFRVFDSADVVWNILSWIPFFTAIALACCISYLNLFSRIKAGLPWPIHFALNFGVQSVLLFFFQYRLHETWAARWEFISSLVF
ncbi:MAG: hypothetical protein ACXVA9_02595 [Bdellovibrionales bacterium]